MIHLWWTTEAKVATIRPDDTALCPSCGREELFSLRVHYVTERFYGTFGRVTSREYVRSCDECGGAFAASATVIEEVADAGIPYLERKGWAVLVMIFVGCLAASIVFGCLIPA